MSPRKTLLLIDDEEPILRSLQRTLRGEDYDILSTTNPFEAFRFLAEHPVQVVISDFKMFDMTGLDLLKQVRASHPHLIRVILSGFANQTIIEQALQDKDIHRYLLKPWNSEELKKQIQELFALASQSSKTEAA